MLPQKTVQTRCWLSSLAPSLVACVVFLTSSGAVCERIAHADQPPTTKKTIEPNLETGEHVVTIYQQKCARCHGEDGQGAADSDVDPLRADQSVDELAARIAETMPEDDPDSCTGDEAKRLARYLHAELAADVTKNAQRISRMTVPQYQNAVADVIGRFPTQQPAADNLASAGGFINLLSPPLATPGLIGQYYQSLGSSKANRLAQYRTDTRIEFDFADGSPAETISADQFAVIWSGSIVADHTGFYEFRLRTRNGARLYVNSDPIRQRSNLRETGASSAQQTLIDAWVGSGGDQEKTARIYLLGGRNYPIRLEFFKFFEDDASVSLQWKPPHGTWATLDYNHTLSTTASRTYVSRTRFPADDRSLGFARGNSVSAQWQEAAMNGAIEAAAEVVDRLTFLAALPVDAVEELHDNDVRKRTEEEVQAVQASRLNRVKRFALEFASVAYRRPLSQTEQQLIENTLLSDKDNVSEGVRRVVIMTLMSPYFLYPDLTPPGDAPAPHAIASRLSFGLWDSIPDAELIAAADNGELDSFKKIESQARRMLGDPRAKAKVRSFFHDWLELEYRDLAKDKQLFPEFDETVIADLRRSLELFIDRVVWKGNSDYRRLLQANYLMLNKRLATLYEAESQQEQVKSRDKKEIERIASRRQFASEFQPVDFPKNQRSGILTHPYLLSAFAYHNNTSPIHRGVFLTRNIVGRALNPPPDAVAFKDDQFPADLTMREKITQLTRGAACMSCHSVINPLGFTLENFDAVGRWRVTDNDKPVDTTSQYTTTTGETVKLASARDVAEVAVKSTSAPRAFVDHVFEHIVKKSPRDIDPKLLDQLTERFEKDNFHIQKLWARIATVAATENSPIHQPKHQDKTHAATKE